MVAKDAKGETEMLGAIQMEKQSESKRKQLGTYVS
jgi:hypothetical protein